MDYEEYRKKYFVDPQPKQRFNFVGIHGVALYYEDYAEALAFWEKVIGPPNYVEGEFTHGWTVGNTLFTLFPSKDGNPKNVEVPFVVENPEDVDKLYGAFVEAGAVGEAPIDTLMYEHVRMAVLKDPFGVELSIICFMGE
ncbi:MAG: hypothetical protein HON98_08720 [Chloroflexi bacterium]|jgi:uncharacterized glyoxalase superfamily protein PhnB|nr:hypothetical protein [Chloroflexota bacterium]MBT3670103.1 hypothetical protein [Chloroflexota bacterium]MBT4001731.1 hypothetical protein [Chloroflexota bacterium]MBT4306695.1 hypothetical protein [Chloroflexota bacterium]MBT4532989.1 hypothetical protein [Chloroflexota bacterium]